VYTSQFLIGGAGPFLAPTLAAVTMGLIGVELFDRQFGKNQSFNSAGNVVCALLIAGLSQIFGNRAIFITAAVLTIPSILSVLSIRRNDINYEMARGGCNSEEDGRDTEAASITRTLLGDRVLLIFLACAFFFHFANAAMLPQLGEMLSKGARATAAPFMSACIVVTQVVIMFSATTLAPAAGAFITSFAVGISNNLVNNLPLGLIAGGTLQAAHTKGLIANAILIGVDLGPNLSVTGSLATILWLLALRKEKLDVSFWRFLKVGAMAMPAALLLSMSGAILMQMLYRTL
jgi:hypothetical protein